MSRQCARWLATATAIVAGAAWAAPAEDGVAVIVGNKSYTDERVPDVTYAHRDADAFGRYVIEVLGFDEANVIDLRDATQAAMETAFGNERDHKGKLWSYLSPEGSDVVVYYSGHGVPGLRDRRGYLLPVNANPDTAHLNGYPIDVLYTNLGKLTDATSVRVFLDACFSGDSQGGMLIADASPVFVSAELPGSVGKAMAVLTASSGTEVASWDRQARHGAFTHHLLDALYGGADADTDGAVTAAETKRYLDRHLTRAVRRAYLRDQTAGIQGDASMVLASASGGVFPRRPSVSDAEPGSADREPVSAGGAPRATGERFRDCPYCPEMVVIPAGTFQMGCLSGDDDCQEAEKPVHEVRIAEHFAMSKHEVMRGEFARFVDAAGHSTGGSCWTYDDGDWEDRSGRGWRSPGYAQTDTHPAVCVSWHDAMAYAAWLSRETGEGYRLPSESEWEYAARAGTTGKYHFGDEESHLCEWANVADLALKQGYPAWSWELTNCRDGYVHTAPVGSFGANGFGLHDVHGNALEWTADCWNESYAGAPRHGGAWETGDCALRVVRGGSWFIIPRNLRSAYRVRGAPGGRFVSVGFRVARTLTP